MLKHVLWGSSEGDSRGRVHEKILDECDKVHMVLNIGMATRWFSGERAILICLCVS